MLSHFSHVQLCYPMNCSPPGSSVHGIFLTRIPEWIAMPSSRGSSQLRDRTRISCIFCTAGRLFTTEPLEKPKAGFSQFSSVAQWYPTLWPHESQHTRPPCPSPTPRVYSHSCPWSRWCHPAISSSVIPFSCPKSLPASGSFATSQLCTSGGQSIVVAASASVLPMNTQDWSLGWTGWISLQSKGLSRVFSNTTVQKHQFFCAQLSL